MSTQHNDRNYWTSLEQLRAAQTEGTGNEFPTDLLTEEMDGPTRRHFLGIMGASMTMAGMAGCIRRPTERIMPYSRMPEDVLPGVPSHYATAVNIGADVAGLLIECNDGRPTKIEGNSSHTQNIGGTSSMHQAMVLDLYDPSRLRAPRNLQAPVGWEALEKAIDAHFKGYRNNPSSQKLAFLSEEYPSPTYLALQKRIKNRFPGANWYTYEAVSDDNETAGLRALFGKPVRALHKPGRAYTVLSLDSDFLATGFNASGNSFSWMSQREPTTAGGDPKMSRLYTVEGVFSLTGTCADNRLRLPSHQIEAFAFAIAHEIRKAGTVSLPNAVTSVAEKRMAGLSDEAKFFAKVVAEDLTTTSPIPNLASGLVIAGRRQPPVVHALAAVINHALAQPGMVTSYYEDHSRNADDMGDMAGIQALTKDLNAGKIETLVVVGGNPVYTVPGNLKFAEAIKKVKTTVCLSDFPDETSKAATWAIPKTHFLEAWGDLVSADGTLTIQQPVIAPLHGAWTPIELLAHILGDEPKPEKGDYTYHLVRKYWKSQPRGQGLAFDRQWNQWLHDGRMSRSIQGPLMSTRLKTEGISDLVRTQSKAHTLSPSNLEVVFTADPHVYDGRFGNNSLLLEAPDPISKISWDNAAVINPATAKALGVENEDRVSLEVGDAAVDIVVWVVPGLADNVVIVSMGYGRNFDSYLPYHDSGTVGFDVNPIRSSSAPDFVVGGKITKGTGKYPIANVQAYNRLDPDGDGPFPERPHVREATVPEYKEDPDFAAKGLIVHGPSGGEIPYKKNGKPYVVVHPPEETLHPPPSKGADYTKGYQWGMVIDLNKCTGCNACLVACMVENNVPTVGKDQVRRGREMHWLRMDRYFRGDENDPQIVHQPMSCGQCENAPCENVCPVQATAHSPEGINDMAYNRCIGTRYCANNCPFKVRRFNFYNYTSASSRWDGVTLRNDELVDPEKDDELLHMRWNPDVTVRFRGVMEKCNYCYQRINRAKRKAKMAESPRAAKRIINDLNVACGSACPTGGITFGDLNDPKSKVAQAKKNNRNYQLLTELNLRTRTSYLGMVRNPNPKLAKQKG